MNKVEAIRGFLTFLVIFLVILTSFLSVKFIMSNRSLKGQSSAVIPSKLPAEPVVPDSGKSALSMDGFNKAELNFDPAYDLNSDGVINMYDYYLLGSSLNKGTDHN